MNLQTEAYVRKYHPHHTFICTNIQEYKWPMLTVAFVMHNGLRFDVREEHFLGFNRRAFPGKCDNNFLIQVNLHAYI